MILNQSRHGLTNGESVVMYKTPKGENVKFQYTFINDDCMYETTRYNMNDDGEFVNYSECRNNFVCDLNLLINLTFYLFSKSSETTSEFLLS